MIDKIDKPVASPDAHKAWAEAAADAYSPSLLRATKLSNSQVQHPPELIKGGERSGLVRTAGLAFQPSPAEKPTKKEEAPSPQATPEGIGKSNALRPDPSIQLTDVTKDGFIYFVPPGDKPPPQLATLAGGKDTYDEFDGGKALAKLPESSLGTFRIAGDLSAIDPRKPTAAFLEPNDSLSLDGTSVDGMRLSHGLVSALGAAEHGFNALELKVEDEKIVKLDMMPDWLKDVAASIKAGKLPLSKGDVLNVSMGNNDAHGAAVLSGMKGDPTYDELNGKLKKYGMHLTPENLKDERDKVLKALASIAKDPHDRDWRQRAQAALTTNEALKDIQSKGIEVVHAAGNNGRDRVDLNFLMADHQLSSVDPATGKVDSFSNSNSLTEAANGVLEIRRQNPGRYTFGDVSVTASDFCAVSNSDCYGHESRGEIAVNTRKFAPQNLEQVLTHSSFGERPVPKLDTEQGHLVALAYGTSFSNIPFLESQRERLLQKKLGKHPN